MALDAVRNAPPAKANANAEVHALDLLVPGMTCAGCMRKVETRLQALDGVQSARVNLSAHRVAVGFDPAITNADALVGELAQAGYDARPFDPAIHGAARADATGRDLLLRLGVAGFAAMNVMLLSVSVWSGADAAVRDLMHWISALIALPAMAYAGVPFFRSALGALAGRRLNMDVPISLAIVLAGVSSVIETTRSGEHAYFDAGVMLIFFLLIGRYLDHRTRASARSAAAELAAMTGRTALRVLPNGKRVLCPVEKLTGGMRIAIAPGERVPADGLIVEGRTDIDRSLVTGESRAEPAEPGMRIHAGMLNLTGPVELQIEATGDGTLLAEIARLVDAAERGRGRYDKLADQAARVYAPGVHALAALAFIGWYWASGEVLVALAIATALLIITCPCALGLAIPTVHTVASGRLFRAGIFLKDGAELERLAQVDLVAFDKTGTLTDGRPHLVDQPDPDGVHARIAASLAQHSRHPASAAIAAALDHSSTAPVTDIREVPGCGVEGRIGRAAVRLGRPAWVGADSHHDVAVSAPDGSTAGFRFSENLRPDAADTVAKLRDMGCEIAILSGDGAEAVDRVADALAVQIRHAQLLPGEKLALLQDWAAQGRRVLMVGDGLNDGPALAAAHASISPADAADVSKTAAGLVFAGESLAPVHKAMVVARDARRRALESFGIAAVYNACAIPLALAGLVTPLIAALAMSGSSVLVVLNALRLRKS
ncbi:MAG: heavy metal translocating P-type ATPase [Pseudomonadota bacterium]